MFTLRDYQLESLDELRRGLRDGHKRQMLCLPTGAGKTVCAAGMVRAAVDKGNTVAFIADRISLVEQTSMRMAEAGIQHGIVAGEMTRAEMMPVKIYSAQTLARRGWSSKPPSLVVIDEAHISYKSTLDMIENMDIPIIGLSATPLTKGLGKTYSRVVCPLTTNDLIESKVLVPLRVQIAVPIDMTGAKTNSAGEWTDGAAGERAAKITGDIVADWTRETNRIFGGPVKTLLFGPTVDACEKLCEEFNAHGHDFRMATYRTSGEDKENNIDLFRRGRITGLASVEALSRGFDVPDALCLIAARPYRKSVASHVQQLGRIMRSAPDKAFGLVLDHGGSYLRLAEQAERFWAEGVDSLDDGSNEKYKAKDPDEKTEKLRKCGACSAVMDYGARQCKFCGWERPIMRREVDHRAGKMVEYNAIERFMGDIWPHVSRHAVEQSPDDPDRALRRAKAQYKDITGKWPEWGRGLEPADQCDERVAAMLDDSHRRYVNRMRRKSYAQRKSGQAA